MPKFKITCGTFRDHDDSIKGPGDTIELADDVAKAYASQLQALPPDADQAGAAADPG